MCGRFNYVMTDSMVVLLDEFGVPVSPKPQYNLAPTEQVPIIRQSGETRQITSARWWLVPSWSDGPSTRFAMFNARSETIQQSKAFQKPFLHRRCIIPATSYIEWQTINGQKQPYEIYSDEPLLFAAIWDDWRNEITSCSMITTQAHQALSHIHKRMPVMLTPSSAHEWLDMSISSKNLTHLFEPQLPSRFYVQQLDNSIGNARNKMAPMAISDPVCVY